MTTTTINTELLAKATNLLDKLNPDMVFTASFAGEVSGVVLLLKDALAAADSTVRHCHAVNELSKNGVINE